MRALSISLSTAPGEDSSERVDGVWTLMSASGCERKDRKLMRFTWGSARPPTGPQTVHRLWRETFFVLSPEVCVYRAQQGQGEDVWVVAGEISTSGDCSPLTAKDAV